MNWFKSLKLARTLYHGTIIDNLESIKNIGLSGSELNQSGTLVHDSYRGVYSDNEWEGESNKEVPVFMSDKHSLGSSVTAMRFNIAKKLKKTIQEVTDLDILNHGLLVVIKDEDNQVSQFDADNFHSSLDQEKFFGLEDGDYYSEGENAHAFLQGNNLVRFLNKNRYRVNPNQKWDSKLKGWKKSREDAELREERRKYPLFNIPKTSQVYERDQHHLDWFDIGHAEMSNPDDQVFDKRKDVEEYLWVIFGDGTFDYVPKERFNEHSWVEHDSQWFEEMADGKVVLYGRINVNDKVSSISYNENKVGYFKNPSNFRKIEFLKERVFKIMQSKFGIQRMYAFY